MDTAVSTFGGYQLVSETVHGIDLPEMHIVVGCTEKEHNTRSEIQKVQSLRSRYPDIVEPIFCGDRSHINKSGSPDKGQSVGRAGPSDELQPRALGGTGCRHAELSELVYAARGLATR